MEEKNCEIRIHVATSYVDDQSEPDEDRYVFAYTITIANDGANGKVQEVSGDGVVGEQPHLKPGEEYRYSSGAVLETPVGAMQGLYRMEADNGVNFDAPIAPFTLAVPGVLH
jgi:ApaG protein